MKILFVMLHPGFIRYYEGAVRGLAESGHDVHLAFEISRDKLGESTLAQRLAASSPRITCGTTPARSESVREFLVRGDRTATRSGARQRPMDAGGVREQAWESLATTVRLLVDYLRFFEPAFAHATKLRDRAEKRLPRVYVPWVRGVARAGTPARRTLAASLHAIEQMIPTTDALLEFIRDQRPDLLLVTPLIELGSQQVDYIKCARRLGIRSALCVASWDNLTSKGVIRVIPDHVVVWNEAQKKEATTLHGVPAERVVVTGAQPFDRWFEARPSRSREELCREAGLDPATPFVLYVGSSIFIAPEEVPFAERWIARLRGSSDPSVASLGILVRPHPANSRQWRTFDREAWPNVAVWPPIGSDPNTPDFHRDYFDSLYYSAGVVGINTSAQLEASIVGRPVFTVCAPEFAHSQQGTLHFQHLVDAHGGPVQAATTFEEHIEQLGRVLGGQSATDAANRRFVSSFIRPFGADGPVTPRFVQAIGILAEMPPPLPRAMPAWSMVLRPCAHVMAQVAHTLAEDRPLWVYVMRPFVTGGIAVWAQAFRTREAIGRSATTIRRLRRAAHRGWYESSQQVAKSFRRVNKKLTARVRSAGVAVKQAARRAGLRRA